MPNVQLGFEPVTMTLVLVEDADFICHIDSDDATDWPETLAVTLRIGATVWTSTVDGPRITFDVDKADVNTVLAGDPDTFGLWYVDGTTDLCWASGLVERR